MSRELSPEEKKRRLEEIKKRITELRRRIESWAMIKISDVAEMNHVYRELGDIFRELVQLNPDPVATQLMLDVTKLMNIVTSKMSEAVERRYTSTTPKPTPTRHFITTTPRPAHSPPPPSPASEEEVDEFSEAVRIINVLRNMRSVSKRLGV
jgi:hypothetical protein